VEAAQAAEAEVEKVEDEAETGRIRMARRSTYLSPRNSGRSLSLQTQLSLMSSKASIIFIAKSTNGADTRTWIVKELTETPAETMQQPMKGTTRPLKWQPPRVAMVEIVLEEPSERLEQ